MFSVKRQTVIGDKYPIFSAFVFDCAAIVQVDLQGQKALKKCVQKIQQTSNCYICFVGANGMWIR